MDLRERDGGGFDTLEIAAQEAIRRRSRLEREARGLGGERGPVLPGEREDAENAARRQHALRAVQVRAQRADGDARGARPVEERQRLRGGAGRPIRILDARMPTPRAEMFAQELAAPRIEDADVQVAPLHGDALADPAGRHAVVRRLHLDTAIAVHAAAAVAVVPEGFERQRLQLRLLLGEHHLHLALRRPVDAGVGPARLALIEIRLGRREGLEAHPAERGLLRMADPRFDLALAIRVAHPARKGDDAVVDLSLLPRPGGENGRRLAYRRAAERPHEAPHEAPHARIATVEPVAIDEILPDGHRIPAAADSLDDQFAIGLAGTCGRRADRHRGDREQPAPP